jgi:hypothetical protein
LCGAVELESGTYAWMRASSYGHSACGSTGAEALFSFIHDTRSGFDSNLIRVSSARVSAACESARQRTSITHVAMPAASLTLNRFRCGASKER